LNTVKGKSISRNQNIVDKKSIPVEIKYGKIDTTGLIAFMKKFKVTEGYIISH